MLIKKYSENIHGNKSFPIPKKVQEATNEYLDENNKIKKFLAESVEFYDKDAAKANNLTEDDYIVSAKRLFEDVYKMSEYYENERKDWFVEKMSFNGFNSIRQTKRKLPFFDKQVYKGLRMRTAYGFQSDNE